MVPDIYASSGSIIFSIKSSLEMLVIMNQCSKYGFKSSLKKKFIQLG